MGFREPVREKALSLSQCSLSQRDSLSFRALTGSLADIFFLFPVCFFAHTPTASSLFFYPATCTGIPSSLQQSLENRIICRVSIYHHRRVDRQQRTNDPLLDRSIWNIACCPPEERKKGRKELAGGKTPRIETERRKAPELQTPAPAVCACRIKPNERKNRGKPSPALLVLREEDLK